MNILKKYKLQKKALNQFTKFQIVGEEQKLLCAKLLVENIKRKIDIGSFKEVEFKVFSQFGDDGIIQWLINTLNIPNQTFIEFGVQDYRESNTRFLMMNDNWAGFVMDGSEEYVSKIRNSEYFWQYELNAEAVFINCENINNLISSQLFEKEVGLLHIDLDGNDYWIWEKIDVINPVIVILEYNSVFGIDRTITVPYDENFNRTEAHYSNLYWGASLRALIQLSNEKEYAFVGCNSSGNNAYFVRKDKLNNIIQEITIEEGYVLSRLREGRDRNNRLTYHSGKDRIEVIRGLPIFNTKTKQIEKL
jgi:hypothetical protein